MLAADRSALPGPLEARVMGLVWAVDEPVTVRAVLERLNRGRGRQLAYTTVTTVMARLAEKGVLQRSTNGRGYAYQATIPDTAAMAVRQVLDAFGDAAFARFADEVRADPRLRGRLQRLLQEDG